MRHSVLEAVRLGVWDYEPESVEEGEFSSTEAVPGSRAKLDILATRIKEGLPLWHSRDRIDYEELLENELTHV